MGRAERVVVLPVVCPARDGELAGFHPCWNEGTHHAVEDGPAALESGETVENS